MAISLNRRRLIKGLGLFAAGPAIVRVAAIMPISAQPEGLTAAMVRQIAIDLARDADKSVVTYWAIMNPEAHLLWAQEFINAYNSQSLMIQAMMKEEEAYA